MKVDFILVGQGLAGTLLTHELLGLGKSVLVFDDPTLPKASSVAAGIINPVVFRRMTKSWRIDGAFPQMVSTYDQLEDLLNKRLYYPCQILKILNAESALIWKEKASSNQLEEYIDPEPDLTFRQRNILAPYGIGRVTNAGRLDIQKLICSYHRFLEQQNIIRQEKFIFDQLILNPLNVNYKDVTAEKIIFCEGSAASQNPYFSMLKFKHSKGELLEVKIHGLRLNEIINQEVFVLPLGNDRFKVGATYRWDDLNSETTDEAREELLVKLKAFISEPIEVIGHQAGIRPTLHDRKPVLGLHPEHPQIGIFNGLGSKGALLGPYFARQLAKSLAGIPESADQEVNVARYFPGK